MIKVILIMYIALKCIYDLFQTTKNSLKELYTS
jgi:hypothetical protein